MGKSSDVQESEVVVKKTINKVNVSGASSSSAAISSSSAVEQSSSSALQSSRDIRAGSVYASSRAGSVARAGSTYRASSVRAGSMSELLPLLGIKCYTPTCLITFRKKYSKNCENVNR